MRYIQTFLLVAASLIAIPVSAQMVNVNGGPALPLDSRPFGKYLVRSCRLTDDRRVVCEPPDVGPAAPSPLEKVPQTITIKQVGCLPGTTPCPPIVYPLNVGSIFYVSATSDSGQPVTQTVIAGNVTQGSAGLVQQYTVTGPGTIAIQAAQDGNAQYAPAIPAELVLTVGSSGGDDSTSPTCDGLLAAPSANVVAPQTAPSDLITLAGTPNPFVLAAAGNRTILIYSTRYPPRDDEIAVLKRLVETLNELAGRSPASLGITPAAKAFKIELTIPHSSALGDLATRIEGLTDSQFTVQDIGSDKVRISATSAPDCATWSAFLSAIRHSAWQATPEPLDMKLFYLSSGDAATAFTALAAPASGSPPATTASTTSPPAVPPATAAPSGNGTAVISVTQPPGSAIDIRSDTTPCVIAGLSTGNSNGCAPASSSTANTAGSGGSGGSSPPSPTGPSAAGTPPPKPPGMTSMAVAGGTAEQQFSDLLVFSDSNPGDDAQVLERKRILAQLDLPRPEMIINAWVMQNSSADPLALGAFSDIVRGLVGSYNDALDGLVLKGWLSVQTQIAGGNYFDDAFYHYIADRFVADATSAASGLKPQEAAQRFLDTSPASIADSPDARKNKFGICPASRYCLGYNSLFQPLKPRLPDFLLTLLAANDFLTVADTAIASVENPVNPIADRAGCKRTFGDGTELADRCTKVMFGLGVGRPSEAGQPLCIQHDYQKILGSLAQVDELTPAPRMFLSCFHDAVRIRARGVGFVRAALADFLFNYKMSQQYPHEFVPYDLSQSADALNTALNPLIDAFNRDVVAFQTFMRADMQYQMERFNSAYDRRCCAKRLFGLDKPSFFNDGLITVRTISGQATTVNTASQSFVDASTAPTISNLLNSVAGSATASGTSPLAGVTGGSQAGASLLTSVLNAYQTTVAQIGRSLTLTATPRSLSTAASAEINVMLNADDSAGSPTYTGGPQGSAPATTNTSHVASHDTTTRIRVESVKLFEVSSFSAIVQRSHSRFPLIPPFIEIPYIGTLAGIPIPAAKEYHNSTAVMSAIVVPTAADIAYGLRFAFDQIVDGPKGLCSILKGSAGSAATNTCIFRRAVALQDLNQSPVRTFHKAMINCFATQMRSPYTGIAGISSTDTTECKNLSFDTVAHDLY